MTCTVLTLARGDVPRARSSLPVAASRFWMRPQLNSGTLGGRRIARTDRAWRRNLAFLLDVRLERRDDFAVISARLARPTDLPSLLELFAASDVSPAIQPLDRAEAVWRDTLERRGIYVFVSDEGRRIAATCMLVTAPNLLRQGRYHGFLENVVTHPDFRGRGHGSTVVRAALAQAWTADCHHVLLQSGRADPRVHQFYEHLGFVPGRRTAYVVLKP